MIVTLHKLRELGACDEALDAFCAACGETTAHIEWNAAAQGLMLGDPIWRRWLGWAYEHGIIPPSLVHARDSNSCSVHVAGNRAGCGLRACFRADRMGAG
jgi:hypothetical protein